MPTFRPVGLCAGAAAPAKRLPAKENKVTDKINRRALLTAGAGGLAVLSLGGCSSDQTGEGRRPDFVMVFDQNKCVGCGECKRACNETNHLPAGRSRVILQRMKGPERRYIRVSCQQCKDSPCVKVCPTGACHHDPDTGIVTMKTDICVGCKYCIAACPYNARYINSDTKTADNCDFCLRTRLSKGELPGCVERCRYHALAFGDASDPSSYVARLLAVRETVRIRPWLGTEPRLRYVPAPKPGV